MTVSAQDADTLKKIELRGVEIVGQGSISAVKQLSPVQVISYRDMDRIGISELSEAVKRFSGITVRDYGGIGGLKTVSIRGLGAHHTAVAYDGIDVSDAQNGQIDIGRFTLDNVEYVAFSVGQMNDIFLPARLFASAGTVNIRTQKPDFKDKIYQIDLKLKGGSFGFIHPFISCSRKISDEWNMTVNADYITANGDYPYTLKNGTLISRERRINSDIESGRGEVNVRGKAGSSSFINAKLYTCHSRRGLPGAVNFYDKISTERLWNDISFLQIHYKGQINGLLSVQSALKYDYSHSRYRAIDDKYAAGFQEDKNTQQEYYGSLGIMYSPVQAFSAALTSDFSHTGLKNNFVNSVQPRRNTYLTVLAAQYGIGNLLVSGSVLYSSYNVYSLLEESRATSHFSPALAFSWQPFGNKEFRIRASYKNGFRMPAFTDLYYLRVGNTNLKPENSRQFNAGLTWNGNIGEIKDINLTVDGYYNQVDDKIVAIPSLYIWKMMNMGKVYMKGVDVNFSDRMSINKCMNIFLSGSYSYQHAIDMTDPQAKNYKDQIPYTPRHSGSSSVSIENSAVNVSYFLTVTGERYCLPQNMEDNRMKACLEHNVSLNKTFDLQCFSMRLQGEILNLFNAQYDVIRYYPMPGRSWRVSLVIRV
jgi:outer membrane cobalamin receptor